LEEGDLVCHGLTKIYSASEGKKALDAVSLSVKARGIFSLIGMNGAGKTTLVRILATQLQPTGGDAQLLGMDVVKDARVLRERIASIPQEARSIPWMTPMQTVVSYLLWRGIPYGEGKSRAAEALAKVGIEGQRDTLNRKLSGGQRRKVMVATVLAADSDITFLDEPTTGLDPISRKELWKSLEELSSNPFLVLTTHYLEEADGLCDRVAIIDHGVIKVSNSPAHLKEKIGGDVLTIAVSDGGDLSEFFRSVPDVSDVAREGVMYKMKLPRAERALPAIIEGVTQRGLKITEISFTKPTLDEVFLEVTGRTMREEEGVQESWIQNVNLGRAS
jgi:ABC-2 type transport system ATP-binding protein